MHERTHNINRLAVSVNFKGITLNINPDGLIGNHFEMLNVSYTKTL